jgi:hypothetical protein
VYEGVKVIGSVLPWSQVKKKEMPVPLGPEPNITKNQNAFLLAHVPAICND